MKVLYILDEQGGGGSFHSMREMVGQLVRRHGVEPIVLVSRMDAHAMELVNDGYEVIPSPYGSFMQSRPSASWKVPVKFVLELARYKVLCNRVLSDVKEKIRFKELDLIHSNINRIDVGAALGKLHRIPHIQHIREFGDKDFRCWSYIASPGKHISNGAAATIAISHAVADYWISEKGLDAKTAHVIYNGVDLSRFVEKKTRNDHTLRLVMVGNIIEGKGQLDAVKALTYLSDAQRRSVRLDFYGDGSACYIAEIQRTIEHSQLGGIVRLMGAVNDIPNVLSGYDVGLVCSRAEGFGRVTVEYMAAGLAVIATDGGANKELLRDSQGQIGYLYHFGDVGQLARAIEDCISNQRLVEEYGSRGKDRSKRFSAEANADAVFDLYRMVLREIEERTN